MTEVQCVTCSHCCREGQVRGCVCTLRKACETHGLCTPGKSVLIVETGALPCGSSQPCLGRSHYASSLCHFPWLKPPSSTGSKKGGKPLVLPPSPWEAEVSQTKVEMPPPNNRASCIWSLGCRGSFLPSPRPSTSAGAFLESSHSQLTAS